VNFVDIVVLVVIALSGLIAFSNGFVNVVLWIASWVVAVLATVYFFPTVQPIAEKYISNPLAANVVAAVGLFLVALLICAVINQIISRIVRGSAIGALDRVLGLLLGLIIGGVIISCAYMLFERFAPNQKDWPDSIAQARTLPLVQRGSEMLRSMVPDYVIQKGQAVLEQGAKTLGEPENLVPKNTAPTQQPDANPAPEAPQPAPQPGTSGGSGGTQGSNANPQGNPDGQATAAGYKDAQRNDLDRLIQSTQ